MYYNNTNLLRGVQHRKQIYFHFLTKKKYIFFHFVRTMSTEYILEGNKSKKFGSPSHKFNSKEGNKILKRKKKQSKKIFLRGPYLTAQLANQAKWFHISLENQASFVPHSSFHSCPSLLFFFFF